MECGPASLWYVIEYHGGVRRHGCSTFSMSARAQRSCWRRELSALWSHGLWIHLRRTRGQVDLLGSVTTLLNLHFAKFAGQYHRCTVRRSPVPLLIAHDCS